MPRSVLLVAHQYWPTPGSGTQVLTGLVRALVELGNRVTVLTCAPAGAEGVGDGPAGETIRVVAPPELSGLSARRVGSLAAFAAGVIRASRDVQYDVVVTDPPPTAAWAAMMCAARRRVPLVYYLADSWGAATTGSISRAARLAHSTIATVENTVLRRADHVLGVTPRMVAVARAAGAQNVDLIPNGVPVDVFTPGGERWAPPASPNGRPFFLYAGNAGVVHGADVFAAAAERLWRSDRQFGLVFMGYGVDLAAVERLQCVWPDRVHLSPALPAEQLAAAYRGSLGALSSLRPLPEYADARPIKTLAGLACGAPATYCGSGVMAEEISREQLGDVADWSVEGAVQVLSAALDRHENSPNEERRLRVHCAEYARAHFDERAGAERAARIIVGVEHAGETRALPGHFNRARVASSGSVAVGRSLVDARRGTKVVHISSAHRWSDNRVHLREAASLADAGYDVHLVALTHDVEVPDTGVHTTLLEPRARLARFVFGSVAAIRAGWSTGATVFHLHDPELIWAVPVLRAAGKKVIYDAHEDLPSQVLDKDYLAPAVRGPIATVAKVAIRVAGTSNRIVTATERIATTFPPQKTHVIHNYPRLSDGEVSRDDAAERPLRVVYVGAMSVERGTLHMVDSFAASAFPRTATVVVAGATAPPQLLSELMERPGWARVDFRGQVAPLEARRLIREAQVGMVLFQRNTAQLDSLPTKMFEYLAEGVPVIASDFPLWRSILEVHECGLLVDEQDPEAIAAAVRRYDENGELLQRHSANAAAIARSVLNWTSEERRLVRLYDELTCPSQSGV